MASAPASKKSGRINFSHSPSSANAEVDIVVGGEDDDSDPPVNQDLIGDRDGDNPPSNGDDLRGDGGDPTKKELFFGVAGEPPELGDAVATVLDNKSHAAATFS